MADDAIKATTTTANSQLGISNNVDVAAGQIGANLSSSQSNLMKAYSLTEGADEKTLSDLATSLGYKTTAGEKLNVKTLQLVAEQRFQQSSSVATLFSNLLEKMDQLKQRIISNMGR